MSLIVRVTQDTISESDIFLTEPDTACGAEIIFLGRVRNSNFDKNVVAVSYDAFKPLAEKIFAQIINEAVINWGPILNAKIIHRVGKLFPGEISLAILVASPHRAESYEASRYLIEQIKTRSPIWKKEHYENSSTEWLQGHALCQHNHSKFSNPHNQLLHQTYGNPSCGRSIHSHEDRQSTS